MSNLRFLNHASYVIESRDSLLLVDPWVEGYAFDKGWALLDKSTSNENLLEYLSTVEKKKFIWISHEHSDHFSVAFVNGLKKRDLAATFIFQKTLDRRVASFVRKCGFDVIESADSLEVLDSELSLVTFPFGGGDSYCLAMWKGYSILNVNDCVIADDKSVKSVIDNFRKYTDKVDLLLTQFGYANWVGNKDEKDLRVSLASEHLNRVKFQLEKFEPDFVIPFASFVYFCHPENFHTNDAQNSPEDLDAFFTENKFNSKLVVLRPLEKLDLPLDLASQNEEQRGANIQHWSTLLSNIKADSVSTQRCSIDEVAKEYRSYRDKIFRRFFVFPLILALTKRFLPALTIYVHDLDVSCTLSYVYGLRIEDGGKAAADISLLSATLIFILKNEYGCNTTIVNGKFERLSIDGDKIFKRHFVPQDLMRRGLGLQHPLTSASVFAGMIIQKSKNPKT